LQLLAEHLPAGILVLAAAVMGKDGQGDRPEAGEAGEQLLFVGSGRAMLLLDGFQGADGGEDVAGLGLFAAGERSQRRGCGRFGPGCR
jgi:hypothetical protein